MNPPKVRITKVKKRRFGRTRYELMPESYAGPWTLPVDTILEIVPPRRPEEKG